MSEQSVYCDKCGARSLVAGRFCGLCGSELPAAGAAKVSGPATPRQPPRNVPSASAPLSRRGALEPELADIDRSFDSFAAAARSTATPSQRELPEGEGPTPSSDLEAELENKMDNGSSPQEKRTVVEEGSHFKGTLTSSCPVDVRGRIEGEVETPSLTVSSSGAVRGAARVGAMHYEGELAGEFDADTVELSGVVKDNTVIRARSMQVRLSSSRGKLQVIFGECEMPVAESTAETAAQPAPADPPAGVAARAPDAEPSPPAEAALEDDPRTEPGFPGEEAGIGRRNRRQRGTRHSEPPPAMG
jgi:cytoskeletal protein CcmA (bactofilin family)